jgi:hypothetical protein
MIESVAQDWGYIALDVRNSKQLYIVIIMGEPSLRFNEPCLKRQFVWGCILSYWTSFSFYSFWFRFRN